MKCSNCGTDNTLKDRQRHAGRCKRCNERFAFEPTAMTAPLKFTDTFYAKLIADLSVNDTLFFTENQLYYLLNRRIENKVLQQLGTISCLGMIALFLAFMTFVSQAVGLGLLFAIAGVGLIVWGQRKKRQQRLKQPKEFPVNWSMFNQWHQQWQRAKGTIQRQLQPVRQNQGQVQVNPQVSDYSFDRVVVCEHDDIAQMLIANNLHFEHNCVVVSINGYPTEIFETVMTMLKRNPNLVVYALHDASPTGLQLPTTLRQSPWFPDPSVAIYDLGLLPSHALSLKNPFSIRSSVAAKRAQQLPQEILVNLSEAERQWLMAGNILALAAFGPKRILQVISQGINRVQLSSGTANGGTDVYWADGNNSLIFFSDSFG